MSTHDTDGREYLRITEAKAGQVIELDGDFTCCKAGNVKLHSDKEGFLWFHCRAGEHGLIGQAEGEHYIGVYPTN